MKGTQSSSEHTVISMNGNCYPHPYPAEKFPKTEVTKGLHLIYNDVYHHSTSATIPKAITLGTPNDQFQKILNSLPHTLTTIYFPSLVCTPLLYS